MKKLIVIGSGAVCALGIATLLNAGVASADDYAGKKYSDAAQAADDAGQTVTVAARFGDHLSQDDCIVERSQAAPFAGSDGTHVENQIQFYLNCNGGYATSNSPGASVGSQEGRDAKSAAEAAAAQEASGEGDGS